MFSSQHQVYLMRPALTAPATRCRYASTESSATCADALGVFDEHLVEIPLHPIPTSRQPVRPGHPITMRAVRDPVAMTLW
jgi:hypothetical protein